MVMTFSVHELPVHPAAEAFPMLGEAELDELATDIRSNGLRDPVWTWRDPERGTVLLDGRNRIEACKRVGIEPTTKVYQGDDPVDFVVSLNIARRHLTAGQKAAAAAHLEPLYAEEAERRKRAGIKASLPKVEDLSADLHQGSPSKYERRGASQAAKKTGASGRATAQFKRVQSQAPDLAEKVRTGEIALDRAERIIRDREAEKRRVEQAQREAAMAEVPTSIDIRCGDFREALDDLHGVDAIITDSPYPHEYLPLLSDLAAWADKVLAPDGVMAVLMGQSYLPEVYRLLDGYRPYRWTACYLTPGNGYTSHPRKVQSNWKPLLIYGGGPRFNDVLRSEGTDADAKSNHKWGQDFAAFHTIIERLTDRGQTVVDPFAGSGTTLLAAHALGRHAVGCDVDEDAVSRARERFGR